MGPKTNYIAGDYPENDLSGRINSAGKTLSDAEVSAVKDAVKSSGLSIQEMVETAWASASSFRGSDKRGGANARVFAWPQ